MTIAQRNTFRILLLISVVYFFAFGIPNNTGAKDEMMVSLFEPDEFAQYPIVVKMLTPHETLSDTVLNFVAYRHYYYGSPFYFGSAAVVFFPKIFGEWKNTQLHLLLLRQLISVLPMLGAALLLTYTQTKFRSRWKSIGLLLLLLSVSAVVENNMWWHVDSLAVFFIALTFYFLDQDELRFGRNFLLAAASVGLATGTKVIGLFFFLTIPTYLLIGVTRQQISWRKAFQYGALFVGVMAAAIVASNPFLLIPSQFTRMVRILSQQSAAMSEGWTLAYAKGPGSWLHIIEELYGKVIFIALAFLALGLGIWRSANRTLHILIATWAIPFGIYVLFAIAIKPTHFFLPILLPVFSSLVVLFEFPPFVKQPSNRAVAWIFGALTVAIIAYQFVAYIGKDVTMVRQVVTREQTEESLFFYRTLEKEHLPRIQSDEKLVVFRDVRMYFPEGPQWKIRSYWNSGYDVIEEIRPDLVILWAQRILDYTRPGAQENAVDPAKFQDTYQFYVDADADQLRGYRLVYRNEEGLFFVSEAIYEEFFK
ncbi:MAG: phospholipid carrier-dependent glycosyltransferase [Chloroflexi bacterium]|nr:phospholipid carrier-dependent glycosyltransferase [Chloroflexota bacterium]